MRKNPWMLGIMCMLFCLTVIVMRPVDTQAASQSDWDTYSTVFDAGYYYRTYPDVAAAYGMNETALFEHFLNFGIREGRSASAEYNPQAYQARYADLQAAYGSDMAAYCRHYVAYGRAEGRIASADGQVHARACGIRLSSTDQEQREATIDEAVQVEEDDDIEEVVQAEESETAEEAGSEDQEDQTEETALTEQSETIVLTATKSAGAVARVERVSTGKRMAAEATSAIGAYTTYYETGVSRATNVELAAERINGVVVMPGENFSFSNTILARTRENGYVEGPIFVQGRTEIGIGGGVCQVSSTLYAAMVSAELPATERHAHSMQVDYMPAGLDATIAGNYLDLRFKNIYDQPLMIQASAVDGELTVVLVLQ